MEVVEIPLAKGRVALIDAEDETLVSSYNWWLVERKCFHQSHCYAQSEKRGQRVWLHRLIMNAPKGMVVDHINGDGLDNRRSNLRICTVAENIRNQTTFGGKSKFKGVHLDKSGTWRAQVTLMHKRINLGSYTTQEQAARAYDKGAKEAHGEFARTNVMLGLLPAA